MSESRVPSGVPAGGQFAASAKGEAGVALIDPTDPVDWEADTVFVEGCTWHRVDADDRYPGQYAAHVTEQDGFRLYITPGDHNSFTADGYQWTASNGHDNFSGTETTRGAAAREAADAANYVTSGAAEADYAMGLAEADL